MGDQRRRSPGRGAFVDRAARPQAAGGGAVHAGDGTAAAPFAAGSNERPDLPSDEHAPTPAVAGVAAPRVALVGPSFYFASGLSAYTYRLSSAVAEVAPTSVVLLRRLVPRWVYPGKARVGHDLGHPAYDGIDTFDGIDWYWGATIVRALRFMRAQRPDVVVLQWWTIATLHTYLVLALACRLAKVPVVLEFHEVQDPGESAHRLAAAANRLALPLLSRLASGAMVHSGHDEDLVRRAVDLGSMPTAVVPLGPFDYRVSAAASPTNPAVTVPPTAFDLAPGAAAPAAAGDAPRATRLLFFGLIRPYKGLEDLVEAFSGLSADEAAGFELAVMGETWEGWTAPAEAIASSPHRDRITFENRYVADDEVAHAFARADALVLPYRRASASGPLNIALAAGLPVIMYDVPQLVETVGGYPGAVVVPGDDVAALRDAIRGAHRFRGLRFDPPGSWQEIADRYVGFLAGVGAGS